MKKLLLTSIAALFLATGTAHAGGLDEPRVPSSESRSQPQPHYLPSYERTQRGYLPSYQYELERRKLSGSFCDDVTRHRRDPFER